MLSLIVVLLLASLTFASNPKALNEYDSPNLKMYDLNHLALKYSEIFADLVFILKSTNALSMSVNLDDFHKAYDLLFQAADILLGDDKKRTEYSRNNLNELKLRFERLTTEPMQIYATSPCNE